MSDERFGTSRPDVPTSRKSQRHIYKRSRQWLPTLEAAEGASIGLKASAESALTSRYHVLLYLVVADVRGNELLAYIRSCIGTQGACTPSPQISCCPLSLLPPVALSPPNIFFFLPAWTRPKTPSPVALSDAGIRE